MPTKPSKKSTTRGHSSNSAKSSRHHQTPKSTKGTGAPSEQTVPEEESEPTVYDWVIDATLEYKPRHTGDPGGPVNPALLQNADDFEMTSKSNFEESGYSLNDIDHKDISQRVTNAMWAPTRQHYMTACLGAASTGAQQARMLTGDLTDFLSEVRPALKEATSETLGTAFTEERMRLWNLPSNVLFNYTVNWTMKFRPFGEEGGTYLESRSEV